ncbi:UPF0415 protein C7orf25 homolog [Folsomia candida]|uniref:UPF0415 protein C7orf25 homolog n=1 Tax=Folsomia candida TaxID=158441 RepID=UPI000B8EEC73|nr:UPF0415 protein C7orf25 homolog [Folsomia candida]
MASFINPLNPIPPELRKIQGIDKLSRQIEKEVRSPNVNEKSSNLPHLLSILKCILQSQGQRLPSAVLKPFAFSKGRSGRLVVDLVSPDGDSWIKISARNPKALNLLAAGGGNFGQKSIVDHVQDYLICAKENPCLFRVPKVTAVFTSGISESLAIELEALGTVVQGERIPDEQLELHPRIRVYEDRNNLQGFRDDLLLGAAEEATLSASVDETVLGFKNPSLDGVTKLNLDIPAFLAYVSNLTNGHSNVKFPKAILANQAISENLRPQKVILDKVFHGRKLYCCETALKEFHGILSTVGGPAEKERARNFLSTVTIVPDQMTERVKSLCVSGNIKYRSLVIFGTGDTLEAVTVTANTGFVRSAKTQGVELAAFVHESRALTEQKENKVKSSSSS